MTGGGASELEVEPARVAEWIADGEQVQVIDVREPYEWQAGHIDGTRHVELVQLSSQADTIDRERPVVFYCRVGSRSAMATQAFRAAGYDAYSMAGGLVRWAHEGRPLAPAVPGAISGVPQLRRRGHDRCKRSEQASALLGPRFDSSMTCRVEAEEYIRVLD